MCQKKEQQGKRVPQKSSSEELGYFCLSSVQTSSRKPGQADIRNNLPSPF